MPVILSLVQNHNITLRFRVPSQIALIDRLMNNKNTFQIIQTH